MTEKEAATWQGYKLPKRRDEYLAGRLAAKHAICDLQTSRGLPTLQFTDIQIDNFEDGRPHCTFEPPSPKTPEISISHSAQYGAALASEQPCGIDIQQRQPKLSALQSRFAHLTEVSHLKARHPRTEEIDLLNLLWTAKETIRKLMSRQYIPGFLEIRLSDCRHLENNASLLQFAIERDSKTAAFWVCSMFLTPSYALTVSLTQEVHDA